MITAINSNSTTSLPLPLSQPPLPKASVSVPPWASLSSGAASGLASCLLLQPMDLLKTRMQQQSHIDRKEREVKGAARKNKYEKGGRTRRLIALAKSVVQEDGWRGLWRGTVPTVARNVPGVAMYFYSVSEVRATLARSQIPHLSLVESDSEKRSKLREAGGGTLARLTVLGNLASGAVARLAVGFVLSPVTIVKARFESNHFSKEAYPSLGRALMEVYRSGGIRGLFRGFSATALRDAPYAGLYLAIYEKSKDRLSDMLGPNSRGSSTVVSASGLFAGTLATMLTHPFDIVKTRMQTLPQDAVSRTTGALHVKTPSLISMFKQIAQTDGMGAYLDGLGLRCARKAASSAIGWTIFEGGRGIWVKQNQVKLDRRQAASS